MEGEGGGGGGLIEDLRNIKKEYLNFFFCLTINYKELFLCKERVILKDARIRKN